MVYLFAIGAVALWSTNALVASLVLTALPVEQIQFLQFFGAFIVFAAIRYSGKSKRRAQKISRASWVLGITGLTGTMIFQYIAFSIGPITEVNVIAYAWPLITALLIVKTGATSYPRLLIFLSFIGFLGAAMVIGGNMLFNLSVELNVYGFLFASLSALCMAFYSFGIGRVKADANSVLFTGAFVGVIITAIWSFFGDLNWTLPWAITAGLYLGVGPMGIGYLLWSFAMQRDTSGNAALLGFLTPITSTLLLVFNGNGMDVTSIFGAFLVILSCLVIGLRSQQQAQL
ncbi:MAG: DMT family transporter [Hyphomicrobiales bacterium]